MLFIIDVSVEGIFRKPGSFKHLNDLSEEIDKSPGEINLLNENAIHLAALMKRFLRAMPEPLLTFKLHRLFTTIQSEWSNKSIQIGDSCSFFGRAGK